MKRIFELFHFNIIQTLLRYDGSGKDTDNHVHADKKIAFYCSSETYTETEHHLVLLMQWLQETGLKIVLLTTSTSLIGIEAKKKAIDISFVAPNIRYFDLKNARSVAILLRKLKIKLVFIGTTRDIDIGSLIKSIFYRKLKLVFLQQMKLEVSKKDFFHTLRYRQYDAWVIPLPYLREQVKNQTHFNVKKIHVIPFCIDVNRVIKNRMSQLEARHRLDLPPAAKIIGIYGHIDQQKKQDLLIRTTKYLKSHDYDIDVLFMGVPISDLGNAYYEFLLKMTRDYKLTEKVHFRAFHSDEDLFYRAIDIFALVADEEASGLQTIKALANGTSVIAMDVGGNKEILENSNLGLLYRPNDFGDFSSKIIRLLTQEKIVKYLKEEGRKAALLKYDKSVESSKMLKLINQLVK